jgi:hypothetical protein
MNPSNLSCPHCGRLIASTELRQDNVVICPACRQPVLDQTPPLIVPPQRPAPAAFRMPPVAAKTPPPTNGLAIASLALSAGSVVVPLAFIPGIICGHIARSQIRRNPATGGKGIALAGILVGYAMLAFTILLVGGVIAFIGFQRAQNSRNFRPGGPPPMVRQVNRDREPTQRGTIVTTGAPLNVDAVNNPVSGSIEGSPFQITSARLSRQGGTLTLQQQSPSQSFTIFLFPRNGESLAGRQWNLPLNSTVDGGLTKPHVHWHWQEGNAGKGRAVSDGYEMQLQLGPQTGDEIPGRLTLRIPGEPGTEVKGDFSAVLE